jgi:hypothetical protein
MTGYGIRYHRNGRRGLSVIELALAASVIVGLLFVTMRVMNMPGATARTDSVAVTAQEPTTAAEAPATRTP